MTAFICILVVTLTFLSSETSASASAAKCRDHGLEFFVNSIFGNDTACMQGEPRLPCKSLEVLNSCLSNTEDVRVVIETDITLGRQINITHSRNITISSTNETRMILSCKKWAGFLLHNVTTFLFSNLELRKCGMKPKKVLHHYKAAMFFNSSSQLTIQGVVYSQCSYTALALIECYGSVEIHRVNFSQNGVKMQKDYVYPAAVSIEKGRNTIPVNYSIADCYFEKNVSPRPTVFSTSRVKNKTHWDWQGHGFGGALGIVINAEKYITKNNSVVISNCTFYKNKGIWGGGISALYRHKVNGNEIQIRSSRFIDNVAASGGGGVNLVYLTFHCSRNTIFITDCVFESNHAPFGGGLAILSQYFIRHCLKDDNFITVENSKWINNSGFLGAAVDIAPADPFDEMNGFLPTPIFKNCTFIENKLKKLDTDDRARQSMTFNSGVFTVTRFKIHFESYNRFIRNSYTALYILSGSISLADSAIVEFDGNMGYRGGALALYSFSSIVIGPKSLLKFTNNHASSQGGGIYYSTLDQRNLMKSAVSCFIRATTTTTNSENPARVVFNNNTARAGGKSIYSNSFKQCYHYCYSTNDTVFNQNNTFRCIGNFTFDKDDEGNNSFALETSGEKFVLTNGNQSSTDFYVIPGNYLPIPLHVIDEYNHTTKQLIMIESEGEQSRNISIKSHFIMTGTENKRLPYILANGIYPYGQPNSHSNFTARTVGFRQLSLSFSITLLDCPPGFHFNQTCVCSTGKTGYSVVLKCNYNTFRAYVKAGYWVGYIPEGSSRPEDLYYAPCTGTKCKHVHILPQSSRDLERSICRQDRTGFLCSKCAPNTSVYFNSMDFNCGKNTHCKYGLLFYILAEIFPMVIFFLVVITFDISFTSGSLTGFLLFSQHIGPLEIQVPQDVFQYMQTPYRLLYGLFNFEYFGIEYLSFCLYRDFEVLDILAFKYITIVVAIGLVLALIAVMRHTAWSRFFRLRRRISSKTSVVNGLSAFLVTCYAQCTKTSFHILKYSTPMGYMGKRAGHYSYYGALIYLSPQHLLYTIPALFSLIVITTLPPLILLLYPLSLQLLALCRLSEHWLVTKILRLLGINKLKPLIDSFQGCYKNRMRFFAGLYFVYRVAIWMCFLLIEEGGDFRFYSISIILLIFCIHSTVQPYKKRAHNILDSLILLNLVLVNLCSLLASNSMGKRERSYEYTIDHGIMFIGCTQLVLIYLPMVIAVCVAVKKVAAGLFRCSTAQKVEEMHGNDSFDQNRRNYGSLNN